jgi:hypothetical protein
LAKASTAIEDWYPSSFSFFVMQSWNNLDNDDEDFGDEGLQRARWVKNLWLPPQHTSETGPQQGSLIVVE